jgi:hypothetical protein
VVLNREGIDIKTPQPFDYLVIEAVVANFNAAKTCG